MMLFPESVATRDVAEDPTSLATTTAKSPLFGKARQEVAMSLNCHRDGGGFTMGPYPTGPRRPPVLNGSTAKASNNRSRCCSFRA